ncbi:hypothetical protein BDW_02225 [Bdellovibrio bacteriovorus W]|nr:hypothetical protein BDW_02225 [Bdellovibrio bacteriovorus W]
MSQQYDTAGLYSFLLHTPEAGLRKMLVDNKPMTEAHFNLMLKVVRGCSEEQFGTHFTAQDFPKVKMGPAEIKIREKFWNDCMQTWQQRGLLNPAVATKAA